MGEVDIRFSLQVLGAEAFFDHHPRLMPHHLAEPLTASYSVQPSSDMHGA